MHAECTQNARSTKCVQSASCTQNARTLHAKTTQYEMGYVTRRNGTEQNCCSSAAKQARGAVFLHHSRARAS